MTVTNTTQKCLEIFSRLEKQRRDILAFIDPLSDQQRHFSTEPEKWNSLQVLLHLVSAEKLSLVYMKRKVNSGDQLQKAGIKSRLRLSTLKIAFILPFKYTAPKRTDSTGADPNYTELKADWEKVRSELKHLIQEMDDTTLESEILNHPRVGMISMEQALCFTEIHVGHHQKQLNRLIHHPSFPTI